MWSGPTGPGTGPLADPSAQGPGSVASRWRLGPRSLTGRLVAGVVSLVTVLVLVICASTFLLLKQYLYGQLDDQVAGLAQSNVRAISDCIDSLASEPPAVTDVCMPFHNSTRQLISSPQTEWLAVLKGSNGADLLQVTRDSNEYAQMRLTPADRAALIADPGAVQQIVTSDGTHLRVSATIARDQSNLIVTGLATSGVNSTLRRLVIVELSIGAGAVALALIASLSGVAFGLRPLRRVTSTALAVTAELSPEGAGLDRRVPVDGGSDTEVGQLAISVNTLLGAVETQFAARLRNEERMREFLADASHELRTPLTSIRGFAELSRMQRRQTAVRSGLDPASIDDDALNRIESEGTRMSRLVDDLLLLARSDHDAPANNERVDVPAMIIDVVESAHVSYPDRPIDTDLASGLAVLGDRDQLLRVVRNLVTNAAVHTAPGGPMLVRAFADGDDVVIQVADSGPGLEPDQAAHVFERFWRADKARTRAKGGSGLGMSIVATIIENHQGAVRFDSSPTTGSTVTVVLPAAPTAH